MIISSDVAMTLAEMIGKRIQSKLKTVGTNEYFIVIKFSVLQEAAHTSAVHWITFTDFCQDFIIILESRYNQQGQGSWYMWS